MELESNFCQNEASLVNFLKKPLFYWVKSFAEKEIHPGDTFKSFIGSNAVTYALEYIGITTEAEQSSLHLSAIFDEDGPTSFNSSSGSGPGIGNRSINSNKFSNHFESETKSRIQLLNKIFNELKSYFEDHFSQLVLIRPPNTVHISCSCQSCCTAEFEKILILLLGGAIQGVQRQDTIRKIKSYPNSIQESLIEAIKLAADNPELLHVKSWNEFSKLIQEEQQKMYETLLALTRKLLIERNELVQNQLLSDYIHGYTSCERKRNVSEWKCCEIIESERNSDEQRSTTTMRQLRDELLEKSELLQECREELEVTKVQLQGLQEELIEAQKQLKSFKKARDELDVLRESQEKTQRLESELQRMKKKLEYSEQYYEKIEILQNENRNFQLKHAILMDQINMLTVDKERLEISFLTQSCYKNHKNSSDDDDESGMNSSPRNKFNTSWNRNDEQLLIDTELQKDKEPEPASTIIQRDDDVPLFENNVSTPSTTTSTTTMTNLLDEITPIPLMEPETESDNQTKPIDNDNIGSKDEIDEGQNHLQKDDSAQNSPKLKIIASTGAKDKRVKRQNRRASSLNTKRTRRALLFSPSSLRGGNSSSASAQTQQKMQLNGSIERIHEIESLNKKIVLEVREEDDVDSRFLQQQSPSTTKKIGPRPSKHPQRRRKQWPPKDKRSGPNLEIEENDADEELSLSPNNVDDRNCDEDHAEDVNDDDENVTENPELDLTLPEIMSNSNNINYQDTTTIVENHDDILSIQSEGSSDNELFFICSSNATTSASSSNLKISNGRNVPIVQITTGSSTMRPSDSDEAAEDDDHLHCQASGSGEHHPQCTRNHHDYTQDLLTNCNIQLSLHHVNSHDINVGNPTALFEYPIQNASGGDGRISSSTAYVNKLPKYSSSSTPPVNFNLSRTSRRNHNDESTSSEDDDSVWYEYGCV